VHFPVKDPRKLLATLKTDLISHPSQSNSTAQPPFYGHYTGQPALAAPPPVKNCMEDFVGAKFYRAHASAD